jgi:hypothetical protein
MRTHVCTCAATDCAVIHVQLLTTAVTADAPLTDEEYCSYTQQQQEADSSAVVAARFLQ